MGTARSRVTRVQLITVSRVCAPSPGSVPGSTPAPGMSSDYVSVSTSYFCQKICRTSQGSHLNR